MGKIMEAFLGTSSFKPLKFSGLLLVAISRLAVLKNQRQVRYVQARSDVVQILRLGQHERSLLRVELVIKDQNMLDAYVMMESYVTFLSKRLDEIEQARICPDELKEAAASLIYASSRCGDFPELQEIRVVFASHYGKEFVSNAVELRNNCKVNPTMIRKLSTRPPESENRMRLLKEIASQNRITLQLEEISSRPSTEDKQNQPNENQYTNSVIRTDLKSDLQQRSHEEIVNHGFSESTSTTPRRKYKDAADAAQAAFEAAAYAAAAARAAVELSKTYQCSQSHHQRNLNIQERRKPDEENDTMQNENTRGNEKNKSGLRKMMRTVYLGLKTTKTWSS